jgi:hypothetical protein
MGVNVYRYDEDVLLVLDDFTGLVGFSTEMAKLSPQLIEAGPNEEEIGVERMVEYEVGGAQVVESSCPTALGSAWFADQTILTYTVISWFGDYSTLEPIQ